MQLVSLNKNSYTKLRAGSQCLIEYNAVMMDYLMVTFGKLKIMFPYLYCCKIFMYRLNSANEELLFERRN